MLVSSLIALALAGPVVKDSADLHLARCGDEDSAIADLADGGALIPVVGVQPEELVDSYRFKRARGRPHLAMDILKPIGTPIVAATDGVIVAIRENRLGGKVVEQLDQSGCIGWYYAHLDAYAPGLEKGQLVTKGTLIGFVGDTGNAKGGPPHLHLGAYHLAEKPGKFAWKQPLNPYWMLVVPERS
jgi:murein DD-endopeptidase MepM/ murein hydrolase activator NlpD